MSDKFSKEMRSRIMARIRATETAPEKTLRRELGLRGWRYRKNYKIMGKPDIAFVSAKVAVFVDGCFWHKCPRCYRQPKTNTKYWVPKIAYNVEKDIRVTQQLRTSRWKVIRLWEHEIVENTNKCVRKIEKAINEHSHRKRWGIDPTGK